MEIDKQILLQLRDAIDKRDFAQQRRLITHIEALIIKEEQTKKEENGK